MDKVSEFLKVAENVGIDKGEIPDLAKAPNSLLEALEAHLNALEGKKGTPTSSKPDVAVSHAVNTYSGNVESSKTATANIDENEKQRAIEEEAEMLERLKQQKMMREDENTSSLSSFPPPSSFPTFTQTEREVSSPKEAHDLLGAALSNGSTPQTAAGAGDATSGGGNFSSDLLNLDSSPWQTMTDSQPQVQPPQQQQQYQQPSPQAWGTTFPPTGSGAGGFETNFDAAFSNGPSPTPASVQVNGGYGLAPVLQPTHSSSISSSPSRYNPPPAAAAGMKPKLINTDVDSSLVNLASNLSVGSPKIKMQHDWKGQVGGAGFKTGGGSWQEPHAKVQPGATINMPQQPGVMPQQPGVMPQQPGVMPQQPGVMPQYQQGAMPQMAPMNMPYGQYNPQAMGMGMPAGYQQPYMMPAGMAPGYAGVMPGMYQPPPQIPNQIHQQRPQAGPDPFGHL